MASRWTAALQLSVLLRHRASLVRLGTSLRNGIHDYDRFASCWAGPS
jgi:hypothetical protein